MRTLSIFRSAFLYSNFILFLIAFSSSVKAQISLTQANFPQAGDVYITASDTNCLVPVGNAGANQTWNLSAIQNHYMDTVSYQAPAGQPGLAMFPGTTLVQKVSDGGGGFFYAYCKVTATSVDMLGYYYSGAPTYYTPAVRLFNFPWSYNSTVTNTTSMVYDFDYPSPPIDSMRFKSSITYTDLADGWGTVTTPSGTRASLRTRTARVTVDSMFYHSTITNTWDWDMNPPNTSYDTSYAWHSNVERSDIATKSFYSGTAPSGGYLLFNPTAVTDRALENSLKIFPNPFTSETTLESAIALNNAEVTIFNSVGQEVKHMSQLNGVKVNISADDLPAGLYYLQLKQDSKVLAVHKLVVE